MLTAGKISREEYDRLEEGSMPTCGSCSFLGTANTMCAVAEALGMALPGSSMVPAVLAERLRVAQRAGRAIVDLVQKGITARRMLDAEGIENGLRLGMAIGGSTEPRAPYACHRPTRRGLDFFIDRIDRIGRSTPHLAKIYPAGTKNVPGLLRGRRRPRGHEAPFAPPQPGTPKPATAAGPGARSSPRFPRS